MEQLPIHLIFNILKYGWNLNIILNKEYFNLIKEYQNKFIQNPLNIEYRLMKCRKKIYNDNNDDSLPRARPTIRACGKMKYRLNGSVPLGMIETVHVNNELDTEEIYNIIPSEELKNKLLPENEKYIYPYFMWSYYPSVYILIYWEIFNIKIISKERTILYKQLFD